MDTRAWFFAAGTGVREGSGVGMRERDGQTSAKEGYPADIDLLYGLFKRNVGLCHGGLEWIPCIISWTER